MTQQIPPAPPGWPAQRDPNRPFLLTERCKPRRDPEPGELGLAPMMPAIVICLGLLCLVLASL